MGCGITLNKGLRDGEWDRDDEKDEKGTVLRRRRSGVVEEVK